METIQAQLQAKYDRFMITQKEAAKELGVSLNTLLKMRKTGEIKSRMVAGKVYINVIDLSEYMSTTA